MSNLETAKRYLAWAAEHLHKASKEEGEHCRHASLLVMQLKYSLQDRPQDFPTVGRAEEFDFSNSHRNK